MRDVNSRGPHSTAPVSQATTRGSNADETREVPASSWLPFGAAEATDQARWMSIALAYPRRRCVQFRKAARLWFGRLGCSSGEQLSQHVLVTTCNLDDLRPARRARDSASPRPVDSESLRNCRQCGLCRLALHCPRRHPYDECISCRPPTLVCKAPGRTRMVILTPTVWRNSCLLQHRRKPPRANATGAPGVWLGAPVVGLCSAVSYSPTPWRVQYHRRWRA
jgi:hypothetical protein